jgi:hypothetical protein
MTRVCWILVRPVEIGSRCQSPDKGSDSGYGSVLECFEQNEFEESLQLEDDVQLRGA